MDCCCIVERMNTVEEISPPWPSYGENYTTGIIVLFYFIVCYLLNMILFYLTYDLCSNNVIYKLINMLKVFQSIGQYWSVSVNLNNPMNFG